LRKETLKRVVSGIRLLFLGYVFTIVAAGGVVYVGSTDGNAYAVGQGFHDVAVSNVVPSKTVVGQGLSMSINVSLANHGSYTENLTVATYANITSIASQSITLPSGSSATMTFLWNTTGFAEGKYILSAYAWPVLGETNTANNGYVVSSPVYVSIAGDVTGRSRVPDGRVDMFDLGLLAASFGSRPGSPRWNPNCDLTGLTFGVPDGKVDMLDIGLAVSQFGKQADPSPSAELRPLYRKTFTWIGHHVNASCASWLQDLNFTDVVVRYDSDEAGSGSLLAQYGITEWHFVSSEAYFMTNTTEAYYVATLQNLLQQSWNRHIYVDDIQVINGLANFLDAVRQVQGSGDIIMDIRIADQADMNLFSQYNFSRVDLDVYQPPTITFTSFMHFQNPPRSLGIYLWAWNWQGKGVTWDNMTLQMVNRIYSEAEEAGCSRVIVWEGDETNAEEQGMVQASLYNYPNWWPIIQTLNELSIRD
jgi:hypothetical protein